MKLKVVDLNDPNMYQEWKSTQPNNSTVYVWDIKEKITSGRIYKEHYDAYVFLYDDKKDKHESYELNFVIPYDPYENNPLNLDHTWYGANKAEVITQFIMWFHRTNVEFGELMTLCDRQLLPLR